jgi:hypothetical protein
MEVRIDERRRYEPSTRVDLRGGFCFTCGLQHGDTSLPDPDINVCAAVGQIGATDDQVEHEVSVSSAEVPVANASNRGTAIRSWRV